MELIGEGKTAKVYRDGGKVVKVYPSMPFDAVCMEAQAQQLSIDAGLPVPRVYGVVQGEMGVQLEMEFIAGSKIVWPKMDKHIRRQAFEELVEIHKLIHGADASALDSHSSRLEWRIDMASAHLDPDTIDSLKNRLATLQDGSTFLCHGDLHPLNILRDGDRLYVIDWLDAVKGSPAADICRSYLLMRLFFGQMASTYLRMSCEKEGYSQDTILQWLPLIAAGRLSESPTEKQFAFLCSLINK